MNHLWEDKSRFKNAQGVRYLKELFFETTLKDKSLVLYTLKDRDHCGYPSLYLKYLLAADLTEYLFAQEYLEGWDHWEKLCKSEWFKPYLSRWRKELSLKLEAEILHRFALIAANPSAEGAFQANKILLDRIRKPATALKRGRPTDDAIQAEIRHLASQERKVQDDLKRMEELDVQS